MAKANTPAILSTIITVSEAEKMYPTLGLIGDYTSSLKEVLGHEGGYTNDPQDPGGPTNWGITLHDAQMYWRGDATAADVRAMPLNVAKDIYKAKYWDAVRGDDLPAGIDYCVFDYGVNSGIHRAIPLLQKLLGVTADGKMGSDTLAAAKNYCSDLARASLLINDYQNHRLAFLMGLKTWSHFGNGWGRRVLEVRLLALKMVKGVVGVAPSPTFPPVGTPIKVKVPAPANIPGPGSGPLRPLPPPVAKKPAGGLGSIIAAVFRALFGPKQ